MARSRLRRRDYRIRSSNASAGLFRSKGWQVAMIGLGTATAQLDTSVNIAFPSITRGFDLAIADIQWVVICYVLTYASLLLALGRVGDTVGHAIVFRIGLVWSAAALLLVAWSPSYGAMLVFRCLQGVGAALVLSCGVALVTSLYGEERRSRALGVYTMMMAFGLMLGPLLGGALTAIWDWPAVFWFRIPIAVAALLLLRGLPVSPPHRAGDRFDVVGGIALILGLVTMLLALNRLREFSAVWFALLSAVAFAAFVFREFARGTSDHRDRSPQAAGFCVAQSRQRAGQSCGLLGLAAGALFSGARPWLCADRGRRHSGRGRGGGGAGRADRRSPRRANHFRRAAGDHRRRSDWRRSCSAQRMDRGNLDGPAGRRALGAGRRPWSVPARSFGYRHGRAPAQGPRRCRQSCPADPNAGHRDRCFDCPDGVRNPAAAPQLH